MGLEFFPGEWVHIGRASYILDAPVLLGKWVHLAGLKTSRTNKRAVRNLDSTMKRALTSAKTIKKQIESTEASDEAGSDME